MMCVWMVSVITPTIMIHAPLTQMSAQMMCARAEHVHIQTSHQTPHATTQLTQTVTTQTPAMVMAHAWITGNQAQPSVVHQLVNVTQLSPALVHLLSALQTSSNPMEPHAQMTGTNAQMMSAWMVYAHTQTTQIPAQMVIPAQRMMCV